MTNKAFAMQRIAASGVTPPKKGFKHGTALRLWETRKQKHATCQILLEANLHLSMLHSYSPKHSKLSKTRITSHLGAGYDPGVGQSIPSQILTTIMPKWCKMIQHLQTCQANPSKASSTSAFGMDVQIDGSCRVSWRSERPWNQWNQWNREPKPFLSGIPRVVYAAHQILTTTTTAQRLVGGLQRLSSRPWHLWSRDVLQSAWVVYIRFFNCCQSIYLGTLTKSSWFSGFSTRINTSWVKHSVPNAGRN